MKNKTWLWERLKDIRGLSKTKKHQNFCDGYETALEDIELRKPTKKEKAKYWGKDLK